MPAALALLVMTAAVMILSLLVMAAPHIGVIGQPAPQQGRHSLVRFPSHTTIQLNAAGLQRSAGPAANAPADQRVHSQRLQYAGQRTMALSIGIHHLGSLDFPRLHIVDLELPGVSEMLEDFARFISNRDSHHVFPFRFRILLANLIFVAAAAAAELPFSAAELILSALNAQRKAVYQRIRQFLPGRRVDPLHRGAGNAHLPAALLLRKAFLVNQADRFIFVHRQQDRRRTAAVDGDKPLRLGKMAHISVLFRPGHSPPPPGCHNALFAAIIAAFPAYVNISVDIRRKAPYS